MDGSAAWIPVKLLRAEPCPCQLIHLFVRAEIEQQNDFPSGLLFGLKRENDAAVVAAPALSFGVLERTA